MNIFNSIRIICLVLNICMAMYILLLSAQVLSRNHSSDVSTYNTNKTLRNTSLSR